MFHKVLLVFILSCTIILADENVSPCELKCQEISSAITQIIEEQSDSIQSFDGARLYLKTERIFPTNHGLLLCNSQSSILLPSLFADQTGCYIPCVKKCRMKCINPRCKYCCWDAYEDGIACPACGEPGDPK